MKPSEKTEEMEAGLLFLFGVDRRETIEKDRCLNQPIGCGGEAVEFRDELSEREFAISGLCQKCQDKMFGE